MLNNPTSSKSVFIFSFYSILVNITCVVRINSDILISSSVNVNYVKKLKIDHPAGRLKQHTNFNTFNQLGVIDLVCRDNKADLSIDIKTGAHARLSSFSPTFLTNHIRSCIAVSKVISQYPSFIKPNLPQVFTIRSCGLMDKASDFESEDCRFESCHDRYFFPLLKAV